VASAVTRTLPLNVSRGGTAPVVTRSVSCGNRVPTPRFPRGLRGEGGVRRGKSSKNRPCDAYTDADFQPIYTILNPPKTPLPGTPPGDPAGSQWWDCPTRPASGGACPPPTTARAAALRLCVRSPASASTFPPLRASGSVSSLYYIIFL
jgi:hypothetical protein